MLTQTPVVRKALALLLLAIMDVGVEPIKMPGLLRSAEVLWDRWGVPHIFAQSPEDLFYMQGYLAAADRLFQLDMWRRTATGQLAEVLGPDAIERDRLARALNYRADWALEWKSYAPDAQEIVTAFIRGINDYVGQLDGKWPHEFQIAGFEPGLWKPEDCLARVPALIVTRNVRFEVQRALDAKQHGLSVITKCCPPDPPAPLTLPDGLDLNDIPDNVLAALEKVAGPVLVPADDASNAWVVSSAKSQARAPLLASDPHRALGIPSLRKTVHLVAPGWNVIGAGEPPLPGIVLGHNEHIAFGFTIARMDQQDLYVEKLNPLTRSEYLCDGEWRPVRREIERIRVKGKTEPVVVELRFTHHGPIIHEDHERHNAFALRWVGTEPGTAPYLAALSLVRAHNWNDFVEALERWKTPSQSFVYADTDGNIGLKVAGLAPIRRGWTGLFPVPASRGYEWDGFVPAAELPGSLNPPGGYAAAANHNTTPADFPYSLGHECASPFRYDRICDVLASGGPFGIPDFAALQHDVISLPAKRFQRILERWQPSDDPRAEALVTRLIRWDAAITKDSSEAAVYEVWLSRLVTALFGTLRDRTTVSASLDAIDARADADLLRRALKESLDFLKANLGPVEQEWSWGRLHQAFFKHCVDVAAFHRGSYARPGDAETVNMSGALPNWTSGFQQGMGATYRQILDLSDWDNSVVTNAPGESGSPDDPHYSDLLDDWLSGTYHRLPYTREAVEAECVKRVVFQPEG